MGIKRKTVRAFGERAVAEYFTGAVRVDSLFDAPGKSARERIEELLERGSAEVGKYGSDQQPARKVRRGSPTRSSP